MTYLFSKHITKPVIQSISPPISLSNPVPFPLCNQSRHPVVQSVSLLVVQSIPLPVVQSIPLAVVKSVPPANNDNGLALSGTAPSGVALAELLRWKAKVGPPAVVLGLGCKQSPGLGHDRARPPLPRTTGIYFYLSGKGTSRVASVFEAPLTIGVVFTGDVKWSFLTAVVVTGCSPRN